MANGAIVQAFAGQEEPPQGMAGREHMSSGAKRENSGPDGASAKRQKQEDGMTTKASKAACRCRQCACALMDGDNRMLKIILEGEIRDKLVVPKEGGQCSCDT
jgi:hypothetical protein